MKKSKLKKMWDEGEAPTPEELDGTYKVTMYPRWLWWWFKDVKLISETGTETGINRAFGFIMWGIFEVSTVTNSCLLLNYSIGRWPWKGIRDYVRREKGVDAKVLGQYIGKFYYIFPFIGARQVLWFRMKRQRKENDEAHND